ncbi:Protein of unknown function DUF229 domain containing protein, protein [Aphelenchoides bicaudatus]|nr:Protein of unknown function DUF229 domain containing protein, protein [Aphelenchoides bicaudatus]
MNKFLSRFLFIFKPTYTKLVWLYLFSVGYYSYLLIYSSYQDSLILRPDFEESNNQIQQRVYNETNNESSCVLPKLNPWDPTIRKQMKEPKSRIKKCSPAYEPLTSLKNGRLRVNCHHAINDYETKIDAWKRLDTKEGNVPGCDIIEIGCWRFWFIRVYWFVHTQIVETQTLKNNSNQPDFYWIVVDTVSMSMLQRALPKTIKVLEEKYQAVNINSRTNAYGMFFGEVYDYNKDPWCDIPLDDKNFIGFDFKQSGYVTHSSEDWVLGVTNWAQCIGFKHKQFDHYVRPFWQRLGTGFFPTDKDRLEKSYPNLLVQFQMLLRQCKQTHNYVFEHLMQFASSYKQQPKFSIVWPVLLTHNDDTQLFYEDDYFADYFEKLHEKAKNAFYFLSRRPRRSFWERFPFTMCRNVFETSSSLMRQLKQNSQQLVSHFDLHASAFQIAKFSHTWNETTDFNQPMSPVNNRTFIGSSIFHQMTQPRICENMGIPSHYCICLQETQQLNDKQLELQAAQTLIDFINYKLKISEYNELCQSHKISTTYPIQLEELKQKELKHSNA